MKGKQFVSYEEAKPTPDQHHKPCSDCPFAKTAIRGWLGNLTAEEWMKAVHGESKVDCHMTTNQQCAGAAIYRANVCKLPRDPSILQLPPNREACFGSMAEFMAYHTSGFKHWS